MAEDARKAASEAKHEATQAKSETIALGIRAAAPTLAEGDIGVSRIEARMPSGFVARPVLSRKQSDPAGDGRDRTLFDTNPTDRDNRSGNTDAD
jgi:hypothetical protein